MKAPAFAVVAVTLLASSLSAVQSTGGTNGVAVDKPFAPGGSITMKLAAGDYSIAGRSDEKIRVAWRVDRAEDASRIKAEADIHGTAALVATTGVKNGMHFTIEVPARSDIEVNLSAGDLQIRGIEGSKTVDSWAGDVSIDVGKPEQYRDVEASVRAGDLSARPFNVMKGGIMRSFKWTGQGRYSLHVKLFAGDLTLR
jgi:hypothetical protein